MAQREARRLRLYRQVEAEREQSLALYRDLTGQTRF